MIHDFSRFDHVVAPIMFASPDLQIVYTNSYATRVFPLLSTTTGLFSRYEKEELDQAIQTLKKGQPCLLPYDESLRLSVLLEPISLDDGNTLCVCVYVVFDSTEVDKVFPFLTNGELLDVMQRGVANPLQIVVKQLKFLEQIIGKGNIEKSLRVLSMIRTRMIQMILFFARAEVCSPQSLGNTAISNVVSTLTKCQKLFKFMKYTPIENKYIYMEQSSQSLMFVDILASLTYRQDEPSISVKTFSDVNSITIKFVSGSLNTPLDVPCNEEFDGIDIGMFSVRRRVELAGGQMNIKQKARGGVTVTLKFPLANPMLAGGFVEDTTGSSVSDVEALAFEYLGIIADSFS